MCSLENGDSHVLVCVCCLYDNLPLSFVNGSLCCQNATPISTSIFLHSVHIITTILLKAKHIFHLLSADLHPDAKPCKLEHADSEERLPRPTPDTRGSPWQEETLPAVPASDHAVEGLHHPLGPGSPCWGHHLAHQLQQVSKHGRRASSNTHSQQTEEDFYVERASFSSFLFLPEIKKQSSVVHCWVKFTFIRDNFHIVSWLEPLLKWL